MADNEWGNAVVATVLSVVDDTALTGKSIVGEIKVGGSGVGGWGVGGSSGRFVWGVCWWRGRLLSAVVG